MYLFIFYYFSGFNSSTDPYMTFISQLPSIHSEPLKNLKDLMVCKVGVSGEMPPDVALIGNANFSIPLYCEGDKLYCRNRKCHVRLLPGIVILLFLSIFKCLPRIPSLFRSNEFLLLMRVLSSLQNTLWALWNWRWLAIFTTKGGTFWYYKTRYQLHSQFYIV